MSRILMEDTYTTIETPVEGQITEKRSKFMAFAHPVQSVESAKVLVDEYRKKYYDARHVCWAYVLGAAQDQFRANDDGEPSGTAGKPILGQIRSFGLTDILVLVVRYFGGVKLGTGGLTAAYRDAAADALAQARTVEKTVDAQIAFTFEYPMMNAVMKIVKDLAPQIISQTYDNDCLMTLQIRKSLFGLLRKKLEEVETLRFFED